MSIHTFTYKHIHIYTHTHTDIKNVFFATAQILAEETI